MSIKQLEQLSWILICSKSVSVVQEWPTLQPDYCPINCPKTLVLSLPWCDIHPISSWFCITWLDKPCNSLLCALYPLFWSVYTLWWLFTEICKLDQVRSVYCNLIDSSWRCVHIPHFYWLTQQTGRSKIWHWPYCAVNMLKVDTL